MAEENKSRVDALSDSLYSKTRYKDPLTIRSTVRAIETEPVNEKWQSPELNEILTRERIQPEVTPFMKKFFMFALFFFAATIIVAGIIFLGGSNFVSSKNVDISVLGPVTASAGEVVELGVTIANKNNADLQVANFSVQYPQGAKNATDSSQSLTFSKEDLGAIKAGDEAVKNVPFVLIGSTGEVKEIKFSVEYKIKGSNATFYKDKIYQITIGNAPMSLNVQSPESVTSGDTFTTTVKVSLSDANVLKNVMLRAEYPYGYSVVSESPQAIAENNVWALGDFSAGTEKTIQIKGKLVGENQDERTFRFYAGVSDNGSLSSDFKSIIVSSQNTIAIQRPSLGLSVNFNGETTPIYVAPAERMVNTTIRFQNNLPERIINPRLELTINGASLNKSTIQVQNYGTYNQSNNKITWNLTNSAGASELIPGESGSVSFAFSSFSQSALPTGSKDISLQLSLTGIPSGSGNKSVTVNESRTVRIASQVTLNTKALYSIGPFKNSGPVPPKVGKETTYTLVWNIGNTQDDIVDAKVSARLGQGVKWLPSNSISSEAVSFDETTNIVTWKLDRLNSGSGFSMSGREAAFQVGLTPTSLQVGTAPALLTNISFTGRNALTGDAVSVINPTLTTSITQDPAFIQGNDKVQK